MNRFTRTSVSTIALGVFMSGTAAFADLSAQQVWDDWKGYMTGFGYEVSGEESTSGNTLTIKDISMSMALPEDAGNFAMTVSEVSFVDNGDGTVSMQIPPSLPITMNIDSPDAEDVDLQIEYATSDFAMTASGDPDNLKYDYSAGELAIMLKQLMVEGQAIDIGTANISFADLTGSTTMKVGNLRMSEQAMTTGAVTYALDFKDPEGEGRIVMNGQLEGLGFSGQGSFPENMNANNMAAMLEAGFGFNGGFNWTGGSSSFNFQEDGETVQASSSSESGELQVAMDAGQLMYAGTANNMNMEMAGGEIPFPIQLAMAKSGFNLKMPISKGDAEQDFALGITMGDFTMSDMIWGIFDPAGQLPRDPATIAMDLTGKAKLFFDIMDPEQMEAMESGELGMPGELNSVKLNGLTVRAAGAELTGTGAFTFDNTDLTTFDGVPAPDGAVDLKLVGGNGLLDKLVAMGLLPEDQAMGARMMMGLFAVPGDGEDTLNSKIEVKADGQILANGQRLK